MAVSIRTLAACGFAATMWACGARVVRAEPTPPATIVPPSPGAPWTEAQRASVAAAVDAMIDASPALRGAHVGVYAIDTATGVPIVARAADQLFQPASTLKLIVGSAAIERLGPAYRFRTTAMLREGTLVVTASGDPFLTRGDLRSLAPALGVQSVRDVAIDASHDGDERYPAGWTWDDFSYDYAAPLSAATIDENTIDYTVRAGARIGDDARIARGMQTLATPNRCSAGNGIVSSATTGSAGVTSTIDTRTLALGCTEIYGTVPLGGSDSVAVAVRDPDANFRDAVRAAIAPPIAAVTTPDRGAEADLEAMRPMLGNGIVWAYESPPLATFLGPRFWIPSDNLVGELLLEELGFVTGGKPGTTQKGIAFETSWLQGIGIDPATVTLADGCGMSQYDRITPRDLVTILEHDWRGPNRQLVLDSLPVGGARGTIEGIAGTPAAGRVFAKTGSMMHVRGLAGYLATVRHGAVTFAFNVDDWNGDHAALAALRAAVLARIVTD